MATQKEIHPDILTKVEDAYVRIDAALPTIQRALEWLGDSDDARTYALARWAIEEAHACLKPVYEGEV